MKDLLPEPAIWIHYILLMMPVAFIFAALIALLIHIYLVKKPEVSVSRRRWIVAGWFSAVWLGGALLLSVGMISVILLVAYLLTGGI